MDENNLEVINIEQRERIEVEFMEVKNILSHINGQYLFDVSLGIGSFLFLEFGKEVSYSVKTNNGIHKQKRGEWSFWLSQCSWTIKHNDRIVVTSNDKRESIIEYINNLKFSKTVSIKCNDIGELNIILSNGYKVLTKVSNMANVEEWILFMPDQKVIASISNNKFICEGSMK